MASSRLLKRQVITRTSGAMLRPRNETPLVNHHRFDGNLHSDSAGKAKALSEQFSSVFTEDTPETADLRAEGPSYPPHT